MSDPRIGVVGLGNMGLEIATRLAGSCDVVGYDTDPAARDRAAAAGVVPVDDLSGLAGCGSVVLSLPRPEVTLEVLDRLAGHLADGATIIETSTVNATDMHAVGRLCASAGLRCIDAAVLSGVGAMRSGDSTLLVGGEPEDVDRVRPVLEAFSGRILTFGELGAGMAAKVVNNAVAHAVMVVLVEAVALARSAGIALQDIADLLADSEGGVLRPLTHRIQERVARGEYEPGMPTDAARKDSVLALQYAHSQGVPLFAIQGAHSVYEIAVAEGLGRLDYAAVATLWDRWQSEDTTAATAAPGTTKE
ncbi:NAD(P)-dependent oxidoreductase [Georgenia sp. Z1491]|uniref:NAD(P)-dependent oxidoreductase n=1 Tax=Georgenia sp. Z1491 TaxID=3416707 RepID=UPI003CEBB836